MADPFRRNTTGYSERRGKVYAMIVDRPQPRHVWNTLPGNEQTTIEDLHDIDAIIIGAGIAGLSTAYCLVRDHRKVLVVDDGPIAGGQTVHTTAHLSSIIDDHFTELQRIRGKTAALLAHQSHAKAIDFIEQVIEREAIDCDFCRVDGYLFTGPDQAVDLLNAEERASLEAGVVVSRIAHLPWNDFDTRDALRFPHQAQFHPLKYMEGLARAIRAHGGQIVTGIHVTNIKGGDHPTITTHSGQEVSAKSVIAATNSPISDNIFIHTKQFPYTTYAVSLPIAKQSIPPGLYWDMESPYHYVRLITDWNDDEDLLVVGGEDHKSGQASDQHERFRRLERWTRERFVNAGPVTNQWSGQVMETLDGLAYIGRSPANGAGIYMITGDSGMGITHGTIGGVLLCDLIAGRPNPWQYLYDPLRVPLKAIGKYISANFHTAVQYVDWLTPASPANPDSIPEGEGAVVRDGLKKVALYRDVNGECTAMSAVCPHLGAILNWDSADKCWVCPAHGSRFGCQGDVINGPANSDLTQLSAKPTSVANQVDP